MSKIKDIRDAGIVVLSLSTAYGLGVLSCIYWELKFVATYDAKSRKEES